MLNFDITNLKEQLLLLDETAQKTLLGGGDHGNPSPPDPEPETP